MSPDEQGSPHSGQSELLLQLHDAVCKAASLECQLQWLLAWSYLEMTSGQPPLVISLEEMVQKLVLQPPCSRLRVSFGWTACLTMSFVCFHFQQALCCVTATVEISPP